MGGHAEDDTGCYRDEGREDTDQERPPDTDDDPGEHVPAGKVSSENAGDVTGDEKRGGIQHGPRIEHQRGDGEQVHACKRPRVAEREADDGREEADVEEEIQEAAAAPLAAAPAEGGGA